MVPKWMDAANKYLDERELPGLKNNNPVIVEFFEHVGHGWVVDDETPWCAAFVGACLKEADVVGTDSLAARSYLKWGKETTSPAYGDVVVFWRGKPDGWQGHVGFYVREDKDHVWVHGGNQNNAVSVTKYSKTHLLGYRKAPAMVNSRTVVGAGGATLGTAAKEIIKEVQDNKTVLSGLDLSFVQYGLSALVILCIGVIIYARWDDLTKKGR